MNNCIISWSVLTVLYKMNSPDYVWRAFGHQAAGNHGLPVPGGVLSDIWVADQV